MQERKWCLALLPSVFFFSLSCYFFEQRNLFFSFSFFFFPFFHFLFFSFPFFIFSLSDCLSVCRVFLFFLSFLSFFLSFFLSSFLSVSLTVRTKKSWSEKMGCKIFSFYLNFIVFSLKPTHWVDFLVCLAVWCRLLDCVM